MQLRYRTLLVAATAALGLALTAPAFAKHGGPETAGFSSGGAGFSSGGRAMFGSTGMPRGFSSRGRRTGFSSTSTPPGWSHGRKTGWRGGTMPPGLAKKTTSTNPALATSRTISRTHSRSR